MTYSQQPPDHFNNQVHHVQSCFRNNNLGRGFSTAQMCLKRILEIISSIEPPTRPCYRGLESEEKEEDEGLNDDANGGGFGDDLNLRLVPSPSEVEESDQSKSSQGECKPKDEVGNVVHGIVEVAEDGEELELELKHEDEEGEDEGPRNAEFGTKTSPFKRKATYDGSDCLGLLLEAARLISGNTEDDKSDDCGEESGSGSKKENRKENSSWMVMGLYRESPVVRSKRGRNQALPSRLRDSVLEPWKRLPRSQRSKQRRSR